MKKFLFLLSVSVALFSHCQIVKVAGSEYGPFFQDAGRVNAYVWNGSYVAYTPYAIAGVRDIGAGILNGVVVDSLGNSYFLVKSSTAFLKIDTGNVACEGYGDAYVTIKTDGSISVFKRWYDDATQSWIFQPPVILKPTGTKAKKIVASNILQVLDEQGGVWFYEWSVNTSSLKSLAEIAAVIPKKVPLSAATDIASGRNDFNFAIVDGYPMFWGSGYKYVGLTAAVPYTSPVSLKSLWKLTDPIKKIDCNDDTYHFINAKDSLYGGGDDAQAEIGDNQESIEARTTYKVDGNVLMFIPGPVHVGIGRTYSDIWKSNGPFSFYCWAKEINGTMNSWGKNKAFNLGNGITINEIANFPNYLDVLRPWRINPKQPQRYYNKDSITAANYPPPEVVVIDPVPVPVPVDPPPVVTIVKEIIVQRMSDGSFRVKPKYSTTKLTVVKEWVEQYMSDKSLRIKF